MFATTTRSRSMTTTRIAPGDSADAVVTGTKPSRIPLVQAESEQPRRVLRGDLAYVRLGNPGEDAGQEVPGLRPGRLGMGEVAAPEHVVDADHLPQLDPEVVLNELHEHVALPVIARQEPVLRSPSPREHRPLAVREVHLLQPVRNPRRLVLDRPGLQPWIPVEDAGEDHRGQRIAHPVVRRGPASPGELTDVHGELAARNAAARRADVQEQRKADVLRGPPEAVVDRMTIRSVGQRRDRDERADQTEPRTPL